MLFLDSADPVPRCATNTIFVVVEQYNDCMISVRLQYISYMGEETGAIKKQSPHQEIDLSLTQCLSFHYMPPPPTHTQKTPPFFKFIYNVLLSLILSQLSLWLSRVFATISLLTQDFMECFLTF